MSERVIDASVVLAVLLRQPLAKGVAALLPGSLMSTVNLAEVIGRLTDAGTSEVDIRGMLGPLELVPVPFDPPDAWVTGLLRRRTRSARLSLADRACLALALGRGIPALTTDRAWANLGLGAAVKVVGR